MNPLKGALMGREWGKSLRTWSAWSTPIDDDRLGYGLLLADGSCSDLRTNTGVATDTATEECLIPGEMIDPALAGGEGPWYGADSVPSVAGSRAHEEAFCSGARMSEICEQEADEKNCAVEQCFCGDPSDTPTGGGF